MNKTGAATVAAGRGQWSGSGAASLSCNPRKFSEKIALQIQRQAEDIAAFQEVMTDITSTRIQAQRVRQTRSLASYYGGSLPNVSQISKCQTGNQRQPLSNSDYSVGKQARTEHGQRDHRPAFHGRPNRRHIDSAPYLSVHLSPPSGMGWRRSANEKSPMEQTPITSLSRTHSDSALHTSVRMTHTGDPNPAQLLIGCPEKAGPLLFSPPVPLIEENVLEEGRTPKLQKMASNISGCDTPGNHISGSLPDLSSLCLPSAAPESSNPQPPIDTSLITSSTGIHLLPTTDTHEISPDSDFSLPSLSSSLQLITNNSLLQPSLSNPNLQATLSNPSLHDSLSSTSLCASLSSSSLKSSFSNQSLRSFFSSSSLGNRSFQSASSCSYSSGIGASRSCSSSSISCLPCTTGQVTVTQTTSSAGRSPHSPLIMPSGEESLWQQPTLSPTFLSIPQGVPVNGTKVQQEVKPPPYPYSQFPSTLNTKTHNSSQSLQHHQSEGYDQCRQNTRWYQKQGSKISSQCKPQTNYMQQQSPQCQTQDSLLSLYHYAPQQQLDKQTLYASQQYQQTESNYQSQQHPISCSQAQQYLQDQAQQFPSHHQQQLNQCWNPQLQQINQTQNQLQYQNNDEMFQSQQPFHYPSVLKDQDEYWNSQLNQQQNGFNTQKSYMNIKKRRKLQSKKILQKTDRERAQSSKPVHFLTSSPDNEFRLHNISYVGLQLTLSQTEALSQKLGQLRKVNRNSDSNYQDVKGKHLCDHVRNLPAQSYSSNVSSSFPSIGCAVSSVCLDDVISDLPFSVPELDLDPFILTD